MFTRLQHQSGAVLVISLVMLLALTLIGITGTQTTSLEEKMAGNWRDKNLAFQAAESALTAGEIAAAAAPAIACPGANPAGYYLPLDLNCDGIKEATAVWDNAAIWSDDTKSVKYTVDLANLSASPRYIIEDMGATDCPGSAIGALDCNNYRITARATGGSTDTVVMVQSILQI
ncbi:MAG: hypothetical protein EPN89_15120 [Methylovulum sp.]|nr:MAG: hypothetical protein EPN89_15120 [Methylovulum sp.]